MNRKYLFIGLVLLAIAIGAAAFLKFNKKYHVDEKATLDNYEVTLKKAAYNEETNTLETVFQIKNLNSYSITINDREHFMLDDIGEIERGNSFHSNVNLVKSNESTMYTLNYSVAKRNNYEITFYSGIKNHKIKFVIDLKE